MAEFYFAFPEVFILGMTCVVLLADLFVPQRKQWLTYGLTQITLIVALLLNIARCGHPVMVLLHGQYILDPLSCLLQIFILGISIFAFVYARQYLVENQIPKGEYYILGLFSILGMLVLVAAHSFLTIFLGLELLSLPLYAMVALQRHSAVCAEASMKYFVLGAISSAILLYGLSMLYGAVHSLNVSDVARAITATPAQQQLILIFGLIFIITGVAFKLGAAPFHMWVPDVYQGAPTPVTLFVSGAPKIAALGMAIRLLVDATPHLVIQWHAVLVAVAIISIALGNIVAIVQSNLKRMLAYSAIAHVGYMLLGLVAATPAGYSAAVFYMINYAVMSVGAFAILIVLNKIGIEAEHITDLRGLNARDPWLAFMMLIIMFSMAGIPPLVGFFAKLGVLEALISVHMVWLATLALVFAIIGAYYYLNVVKVMYFEEPEGEVLPVTGALDLRVAVTVNGLIVLLLGMFPSALIEMCRAVFA
jgi:NADH-quinone oxidoreductase subunit N